MKLLNMMAIVSMIATSNQLLSQISSEKNALQIIEKAIQARGGKELLSSIKTLYSRSETVMDGRNVNWITKEMVPNKGSFEIEYQGRIVYRSWFDGKTGYELVNGERKLADPAEFKDKADRKYIINELAYIDPKLYKIELIEENPDKLYYKIKETYVTGKVSYLYYDIKSFFLSKEETVENGEKNTFSTVLQSDYKKFGDLWNATKSTFVSEDGNQEATLVELYYNKNIEDKYFK
ncbi:hypothetical protein BOQ62_16405 [Chryseobacterium sp. CH21]|uniref:hypothetical protein n=1 Tax=Chryseobacterium sp. CH21 TaxID=713556 RepID=UPI00100AAEE8|nr:hypothetical protein [Chryseobacterium sp. CH21]RXM38647.1 hypothetical protein BOQ62_16405 [Chryseobacterium sp. CH21]